MDNEKLDIILYESKDGKSKVSLFAKDGNVWLNQKQIAELFDTTKQNISLHIKNIFNDKELNENSVVKEYLTTATDDKPYKVSYYSLEMILSIGYRVRSVRGKQFRQWATVNLQEYLIKGFVIDEERLKNPNGRYDYFDELLASIRDIRASEKRFYQKIRDLFSLSSDYDKSDKSTQIFFAETQNKLLYAVTKKTAAEIVIERADSNKKNMGLTAWKGSVVRKHDISIAKNYLTHDEVDTLNRLVVIFLETAELRVKDNKDLKMSFWRNNVDKLLEYNGKEILKGSGSVSSLNMEKRVSAIYTDFDRKRKKFDAENADKEDVIFLERLEKNIKIRKK